jgi:PEP-CTERM motif
MRSVLVLSLLLLVTPAHAAPFEVTGGAWTTIIDVGSAQTFHTPTGQTITTLSGSTTFGIVGPGLQSNPFAPLTSSTSFEVMTGAQPVAGRFAPGSTFQYQTTFFGDRGFVFNGTDYNVNGTPHDVGLPGVGPLGVFSGTLRGLVTVPVTTLDSIGVNVLGAAGDLTLFYELGLEQPNAVQTAGVLGIGSQFATFNLANGGYDFTGLRVDFGSALATLSVVPEPPTWLLVATGLLGVWGWRRVRPKQKVYMMRWS